MPLRSRQGLTSAALFVALAMRSLIPLGYMPGNLLTGEFMVLCPSGGGALFLGDGAAHRHASHAGHASTANPEQIAGVDARCPIGSVLLSGAAPAEVDSSHDLPLSRHLHAGTPPLPALRPQPSARSSRGPPATSS